MQLTPTSVKSITLGSHGSGYSSPTVSITGGGGLGATATATLATGTITSVTLTVPGSGYTTAPTITTSGGGGTGAVIVATLAALTFVDITPMASALVAMKMTQATDLSSLPPTKFFPCLVHTRQPDVATSSLVQLISSGSGNIGVDFAMNDTRLTGINGQVPGTMVVMYLTESQFAAFAIATPGFIQEYSTTLIASAISNGLPHLWTFHPAPVVTGAEDGLRDFQPTALELKLWEIRLYYVGRITTLG